MSGFEVFNGLGSTVSGWRLRVFRPSQLSGDALTMYLFPGFHYYIPPNTTFIGFLSINLSSIITK